MPSPKQPGIKTHPQPSPSRDKTHRVDAAHTIQKDDPGNIASKDERAAKGRNSALDRQGRGVDERGGYGKAKPSN